MAEKPGNEPINPIQYIGDVSSKASWQTDFESTGLTARQYAAIQLRVPEAEEKWLNDMIRRARRMDMIQFSLQGALVQHKNITSAQDVVGMADDCLKLEKETNKEMT